MLNIQLEPMYFIERDQEILDQKRNCTTVDLELGLLTMIEGSYVRLMMKQIKRMNSSLEIIHTQDGRGSITLMINN